jgi:DNA ligase-1
MFSRNGKELGNFPHVAEQISAVVKKAPPKYDLVLDGEIMSSSFQDLMTQVHRKSDVKANDAILNLFDMCPLEDFEKVETSENYGTFFKLIKIEEGKVIPLN